MPKHPGSSHNPAGGGGGLAASTLAQQGIPQGVLPTAGAPDAEAMSEIVQMLRGGSVGAERFLQLLSLLAGSTLPEMQAGPAGPAQGGQGGPPSIQDLLG